VTAANPTLVDERSVFLSASYQIGARLVRLVGKADALTAEVEWSADDLMSSQYATSVRQNGWMFGLDGREDVGVPSLRSFDPRTRQIFWSKEGFGSATLIRADNTLLAMKTDGELVIVDATNQAYRELARFQLFESTTRALPALSGGRLFVRDESTLKCFEVGGAAR
jgi:hypothetical protein